MSSLNDVTSAGLWINPLSYSDSFQNRFKFAPDVNGDDGIYDTGIFIKNLAMSEQMNDYGGGKGNCSTSEVFQSSRQTDEQEDIFNQMVGGSEACGVRVEQEMKVMIALIWNPGVKLLYFARVSNGPLYQELRSQSEPCGKIRS